MPWDRIYVVYAHIHTPALDKRIAADGISIVINSAHPSVQKRGTEGDTSYSYARKFC